MCIAILVLSVSSLARAEQPPSQLPWNYPQWNENLGIFWVRISEPLALDLNAKENINLVTGVLEGSAAENAGLKKGDVILATTLEIWGTPGKSGPITISRGGRVLDLNITTKKHSLVHAKLVGDLTPRSEPKTIVVDQTGDGDYRTITGAMTVAAFGDTLLIQDGMYREGVLLTNGVTIQGTGTRGGRVEAAIPFQIIGSHEVTIRALTVTGSYHGLLIMNSKKITISDCDITTGKGEGILMLESGEVLVQGCSLSGKDETKGIVVSGSQARIEDNIISEYEQGIILKEASRANIFHNLLDANKFALAAFDSEITVKKNAITGKGEAVGIYLQNSQAAIEDSSIRRYEVGIYASQAQGEVLNNTVTQNDFGIVIQSGSIKVLDNLVLNNKYGIQLFGDEAASDASEKATIARNTITGNVGAGIYISNFKADIHYNLIEGNGGGIAVDQSNTNIRNNTIVLQRGAGIEIELNSQTSIYNNIIAFNAMGISSDVSSLLKMGFNDVYGNFARKEFPLQDGNYLRKDRLITRSGEKIHILIYPAYDLKTDTDLNEDPKFVKLGSDYRLMAESPLAKKKGKDGAFIGAFPPATKTP